MKELTMEQLTVVNGGSDDIAGCKAAYWGMNGGKAGGGFIGGTVRPQPGLPWGVKK
ncbi:hypothetical protein ACU01Y_004529 [Salmonella enterica subsp. enterica serovar Newport]|nr:hypothetical protein [Salmonella enterica subsp. enterica serovar Newport]